MYKIVYRLLVAAAMLVVAFNRHAQAQGGGGPGEFGGNNPFRINMQYGFGPTYPGTPQGVAYWNDVGNWQVFLINHGEDFFSVNGVYFELGDGYPNNNFDYNTELATKDWQSKNGVKVTGIVDKATYDAATHATTKPLVGTPLNPPYPTSSNTPPPLPKFDPAFTRNLELGDGPNGPAGAPPNNMPYWLDVSQWQDFLKRCGMEDMLMGSGYPNGNFDAITDLATKDWQSKNFLNPNGIVDADSVKKAVSVIQKCVHVAAAPEQTPAPAPAAEQPAAAAPPAPTPPAPAPPAAQ